MDGAPLSDSPAEGGPSARPGADPAGIIVLPQDCPAPSLLPLGTVPVLPASGHGGELCQTLFWVSPIQTVVLTSSHCSEQMAWKANPVIPVAVIETCRASWFSEATTPGRKGDPLRGRVRSLSECVLQANVLTGSL